MEALRKFEGSSLDELLEHVYRECGPQARIVEANRIRRGGVGGFFAREGFEVVVEPDPTHQPVGTTEMAGELPAPPPPPPPAPPTADAGRGRRLDVFDTDEDDSDELVADLVGLTGRSAADLTGRSGADQSGRSGADQPGASGTDLTERSGAHVTAGSPVEVTGRSAAEAASGPPPVRTVSRTEGDRARPVSFGEVLEDAMTEPGDELVERDAESESIDQALLLGEPDEELTMTSRLTDNDLHALLASRAANLHRDEPSVVDPVDLDKAAGTGTGTSRRAESPTTTTTSTIRSGKAVVTQSRRAGDEPLEPPVSAAGATITATPPVVLPEPPGVEHPGSRALALAAYYSAVPIPPEAHQGPGAVAVVGYRGEALAVAEHLAAETGPDTRVILATNRPVPGDAATAPLRSTDDVVELCRPKGKTGRRARTTEYLVVVVDLGGGPSGLLWAQRMLQAMKAEQVRLAVNVEEERDDLDATIELLGCIDMVDVVIPDQGVRGIDPTPLLSVSAPVATLDGLPATPGLWAALMLEMEGSLLDG